MRACVTDSEPVSPWSAVDRMSIVTRFCAWCLEEFLPLDRETLFTPDTVERYVLTGMRDLQPSCRRTHLSQLSAIGRTITRRAPWPPARTGLARNRLATPYTPAQVAGYLMARRTPHHHRPLPGHHRARHHRAEHRRYPAARHPRARRLRTPAAHPRRPPSRRATDRPDPQHRQEPPQPPPPIKTLTGYDPRDALQRFTLETAAMGAPLLGWPEAPL